MRVEGYVDLYGVWLWLLVLQCQLTGRFHSLAFPSGWLSVFVGCSASSSEKLRSLIVLRGELQTCLCPAVPVLTVTLESLSCNDAKLPVPLGRRTESSFLSFGAIDRSLKLKNRIAVLADVNMSTWLAGYANVANWLPDASTLPQKWLSLFGNSWQAPQCSVAWVDRRATSSVPDTLQQGVGINLVPLPREL